MDEQGRLDNELADLTNSLLEKRTTMPAASGEIRTLEPIVIDLERLIQPDVPPSETFRIRLTQRLIEEWNLLNNRRSVRRFNPRPRQLIALAASVAIILALTAILLNNSSSSGSNGGPMSGTAFGGDFIIVAVLLIAGGAAAFVFMRRQK